MQYDRLTATAKLHVRLHLLGDISWTWRCYGILYYIASSQSLNFEQLPR